MEKVQPYFLPHKDLQNLGLFLNGRRPMRYPSKAFALEVYNLLPGALRTVERHGEFREGKRDDKAFQRLDRLWGLFDGLLASGRLCVAPPFHRLGESKAQPNRSAKAKELARWIESLGVHPEPRPWKAARFTLRFGLRLSEKGLASDIWKAERALLEFFDYLDSHQGGAVFRQCDNPNCIRRMLNPTGGWFKAGRKGSKTCSRECRDALRALKRKDAPADTQEERKARRREYMREYRRKKK